MREVAPALPPVPNIINTAPSAAANVLVILCSPMMRSYRRWLCESRASRALAFKVVCYLIFLPRPAFAAVLSAGASLPGGADFADPFTPR